MVSSSAKVTPFGSRDKPPTPGETRDGASKKRAASPTAEEANQSQRSKNNKKNEGAQAQLTFQVNMKLHHTSTGINKEVDNQSDKETQDESITYTQQVYYGGEKDRKKASNPNSMNNEPEHPAPGDDTFMDYMNSTEFATEDEGQEFLQRQIANIIKSGGLQCIATELHMLTSAVSDLIEAGVDASNPALLPLRSATPGRFRSKSNKFKELVWQFEDMKECKLLSELRHYEYSCRAVESSNGTLKSERFHSTHPHEPHLTLLDHLANTANGYLASVNTSPTKEDAEEQDGTASEQVVPMATNQMDIVTTEGHIDDVTQNKGTSSLTSPRRSSIRLRSHNLSPSFTPRSLTFQPLNALQSTDPGEQEPSVEAKAMDTSGDSDDQGPSSHLQRSSGRSSTVHGSPPGKLLSTVLISNYPTTSTFHPYSGIINKGQCKKQICGLDVADEASVESADSTENTGRYSPTSPAYSPSSSHGYSPTSPAYSPVSMECSKASEESKDLFADSEDELSRRKKTPTLVPTPVKLYAPGFLGLVDKFGNPMKSESQRGAYLFEDDAHLQSGNEQISILGDHEELLKGSDPIIREFNLESDSDGGYGSDDTASKHTRSKDSETLSREDNTSSEDDDDPPEDTGIDSDSFYEYVPSLRTLSPAGTEGYAMAKALPFKIWMHYAGDNMLIQEISKAAFNANVAVESGKFEQFFSKQQVVQYLKEICSAYAPPAFRSTSDDNRRDEYYALMELLRNVLYATVHLYPRERRRQFRPNTQAETHLYELEKLPSSDRAIGIMSSILFVMQYVRQLNLGLSFYKDGKPAVGYDKDISNGTLRRRLMRLSKSRMIFDALFPKLQWIGPPDPSESWMNRVPLMNLPMPFVCNLLRDLPSLYIDDNKQDIITAVAAEVAEKAKQNIIRTYSPSPRTRRFDHLTALYDHLIGFIVTNIYVFYELKELLRKQPANLALMNVHALPPMVFLAGPKFISYPTTTATRWDDQVWLNGRPGSDLDANLSWVMAHTPNTEQCLRLNGHRSASHQANVQNLKKVDPTKLDETLDLATKPYYDRLRSVDPIGLEEVERSIQDKFKPQGKMLIFTSRCTLRNYEDLTDEYTAFTDPKCERGIHDYAQFFDKYGRLILSQPNGKPVDYDYLFVSCFQVRKGIEILDDGSTPEEQRAYIQSTDTMSSRENDRLVLKKGLTGKNIPFDLADRMQMIVVRDQFDRKQLVLALGMTTIHYNDGIKYDDCVRRKYSVHNFMNDHPERLYGQTFRWPTDPINMRRPVGNYFGERIPDSKALHIEDYPTYGKSSKAYSWNVLPNQGSPLPPFIPSTSLEQIRSEILNAQLNDCTKENGRYIFIQPRKELPQHQEFHALMASARTRSASNASNKSKLHVKTVVASEEIDSISSDDTTEAITNATQAVKLLSPIGEQSTPASQASTKSGPTSSTISELEDSQYPPLTQPGAKFYRAVNYTPTDPSLLAFESPIDETARSERKQAAGSAKELPKPSSVWSKKDIVDILKHPEEYASTSTTVYPVREQVHPPLTNLSSKEQLYPSFFKPKPFSNAPTEAGPKVAPRPLEVPSTFNLHDTEEEESNAESDKKPPFELHTPEVKKKKAQTPERAPPDPPGDSSSDDSESNKGNKEPAKRDQTKKQPIKKNSKKEKERQLKKKAKKPIADEDEQGDARSEGAESKDSASDSGDSASDDSYKILKCPSVETLTRILVKHARNSKLRNLDYQNDLDTRRRRFNSFIDILTIVCKISPWTSQIFSDWPSTIQIDEENVNIALFNLIFTHANEACQKHLLEDGDSCAKKALKTLQRHCAPITDDHLEKMDIQFRSLTQGETEVATSYFNRIRETKRDCFHAGLVFTSLELLSRAIRGASSHHLYDTTYKSFERKLDDYRLNRSNPEPTFIELEVALARIDERRGLTVTNGQPRRNNSQQQGAYVTIANGSSRRNLFSGQNNYRRNPNYGRSNNFDRRGAMATGNTTRHCTHCNRPGHNFAECRTRLREGASTNRQPPPSQSGQRFGRAATNLSNRTSHFNNSARPPQNPTRTNNSTSNTRGACHSCGRLGHYARDCRSRPQQAGSNENRRPHQGAANFRRLQPNNNPHRNETRPQSNFRSNGNGPRALLAQSTAVNQEVRLDHFETALVATIKRDIPPALKEMNDSPLLTLPPYPEGNNNNGGRERESPTSSTENEETPEDTEEDEIPPYNPMVMNNYLSGDPEYFHEDPASPHQRFGPPILQNWIPDSGATSHFTPVYSDLVNTVPSCHHVQMADGSTVVASHVGDVPCYFTSDQGDPCTILLTQVYYVAGLNFRLLSLNYSTAFAGNSVQIANNATTLTLPNNSTFTWPVLRREHPLALATSIVSTDPEPSTKRTISPATSSLPSMSLELVSRRLGFRNTRTLLTGSLHSVWRDSQLVPTTDSNNWPVKISVSHAHARSKEPMNTGSTAFNYLHLDLIRNPYLFGLTANTNFTAYLFIVATPGKLVGWVGLREESTEALLAGLKSWLVATERLGRKHNVRFIRTDAGTAFTSDDFVKECVDLNIKIEAAAPKHQEMNGICESKWKQVHSLANTLLTNARLGGAFFHFAHAYAVQITNIMPAKNIVNTENIPTTPYQLCYGRKPRIRNFRTFGCPTYFKRYEPTMGKHIVTKKQQIQKASRGIFLGFPDNSAGWLVYSAEMKHKLEISRDAYFDEYFQSALTFDSKPFQGAVAIRPDMDPEHLAPAYSATSSKPALKVGSVADLGVLPSEFEDSTETAAIETINSESEEDDEDAQSLAIGARSTKSRNSSINVREKALCAVRADFAACNERSPEEEPGTALAAIDSTLAQLNEAEEIAKYLPEPQSFKAILKCDPDIKKAWLHSIFLEIKNLIDNNTFILDVKPNKGELITPVKLVNKAKQAASGELDKLKSRLVARGDYQKRRMKRKAQSILQAQELQKEINAQAIEQGSKPTTVKLPTTPDEDTWSPNASARAVKLFIAFVTSVRRTIKEADFIGAYLQAKMKGRHFVILSKEYAEFYPEYAEYFGVPLLLNKGMYGLVFSGKLWNEEYSNWLKSQGFVQSQADQSIFIKRYPHGGWLRLIFFVDDMLYSGSTDEIEMEFQRTVHDRFHVKFLGPAHWFLQMRLHQHKDKSYTLDQHRYVLNTLQRYDPHNLIKKRKTPFPTDYLFSKENRPKNEEEIKLIDEGYSSIDFRSAVCTLLYLAYNTRADILFAVTKLAKACVCPGLKDYEALYWLMGYIKERPDLAIKFYPNRHENPIKLLCTMNNIPYSDLALITDASWADCPDTGRSTVGYLLFWQGALIEANTSVPTPIAQSSAEAEYLSACCGAMAAAHIRMIIYDLLHLGTPEWKNHSQMLDKTPLLLMTDNAATVQIAKSGRLTRKTRHIEKRFHYVREAAQTNMLRIFWLPGSQMLADVMTKSQAAYKIDPHLPKILSKLPLHMIGKQNSDDDQTTL